MEARFALVDPSTYTTLTHIIWLCAALAGIAICAVPVTWKRAQHLSTLVHEVGHGLGGLFAGRKFNSLTLHPDASGVTYTTGAGRLGMAFCSWSGYAGPATLALLLSGSVAAGASSWLLLILGAILLLTLIRSRSAFTLIVVLAVVLGAFLLWWFPIVELQTGALVGLAAFFLAAGFRQIAEAWSMRKRDGGEADADALARLLFLPEVVWLTLFHVWTATCTVLGAGLLLLPVLLA